MGETAYLSADRPITLADQDLLDRGHLAESLASAISGWHGKDSLVLALHGSWGSGKTSVKNLTVMRLPEGLRVLEFNPWQWRGHDEISTAFFRELGRLLGQTDSVHSQLAERWQDYAAYLNVGTAIARGARVVASAAWVLVALLMGFSLTSGASTRTTLAIVTAVAVLIAGVLTASGEVAGAVASLFRRKAERSTRSLEERKSDMASQLARLEMPILVVIDDVDRLSVEEIAEVFQLVKANADFPKIVYMVLFDRQVVAAALDVLMPGHGDQFLEKVVQVAFQVPLPDQHQLERVLLDGIQEIVGKRATDRGFSAERWRRLYDEGLRPFFKNLRDIYRFLAALDFDVSLVYRDGALDVNGIDFLAIETLRVFEPEIYRELPALKAFAAPDLYDLRSRMIDYSAIKAQTRTQLDALVDSVQASRREHVRLMLRMLFPYYVADDNNQPEGSLDEWLRDLRVCHHRNFDRYFQYAIPQGDISESEVSAFVTGDGGASARTEVLMSLAERGLLEVMLDHLDARKTEISLGSAEPIMTALFNIGERVDEEPHGFLGPRPLFDARRVIESLLERTDADQRGVHLSSSMRASTGLYLAAAVLDAEKKRHEKHEPGQIDPLLDDEQLQGARAVLAQLIEEAANEGRLSENPRLGRLLFFWRDLAHEKAREWVETLTGSDEGMLRFLNLYLQRGPDRNGRIGLVPGLSLATLELFVDVSHLQTRAAEMRGHRVSDVALDALEQVLNRREQGLPDDPFFG